MTAWHSWGKMLELRVILGSCCWSWRRCINWTNSFLWLSAAWRNHRRQPWLACGSSSLPRQAIAPPVSLRRNVLGGTVVSIWLRVPVNPSAPLTLTGDGSTGDFEGFRLASAKWARSQPRGSHSKWPTSFKSMVGRRTRNGWRQSGSLRSWGIPWSIEARYWACWGCLHGPIPASRASSGCG